MSFILDALKKSELERQRQAVPGLVESSVARPRQRLPIWALALCALLGVNLIVLLVVLMRGWITAPAGSAQPDSHAQAASESTDGNSAPTRRRAASTGTSGASATTGVTAATAPTKDTGTGAADADGGTGEREFSPLDAPADASPVYAPEVPVTSVAPLVQAPPQTQTSPARQPLSGSPAAHARRRDPLLNDGDYKAEEENLPSVSELNLTGAQALPELHLDVHVFATNSAERFVFINMRKYHEGATLQEGPTIERIRRDGVILDYQGLRFLLPRQ